MLITDHALVPRAKLIADALRHEAPDIAASIDRLIETAEACGDQTVPIRLEIKCTLEKFDGEKGPDSVPVETITGEG